MSENMKTQKKREDQDQNQLDLQVEINEGSFTSINLEESETVSVPSVSFFCC